MRSILLEQLALGARVVLCPFGSCLKCTGAHVLNGNERTRGLGVYAMRTTPGMVAVLLRQGVPEKLRGGR